MSIQDILTGGGITLFVLATIVQIAPVKVNPWSFVAKAIGRAINAEVLKELSEVKVRQQETQRKLDEHIQIDDERDADLHRNRILVFNCELLRKIPHTREGFIEILAEIDAYERYCREHEKYENNRAVHAIANIKRVYDDRLRNNDFLQ